MQAGGKIEPGGTPLATLRRELARLELAPLTRDHVLTIAVPGRRN